MSGKKAWENLKGVWTHIPKSTKAYVGGGAALGAATQGYAAHRQRKLMTPEQKKQNPGVFVSGLSGAISGGQSGAGLALAHHLTKSTGKKRYLAGALGATGAGAVIGGVSGAKAADKHNDRRAKGLWPNKGAPKADRKAYTVSSAMKGAEFGAGLGSLHAGASYMKHERQKVKAKMRGKPAPGMKVPSWLSGATTKAEASKRYKARAREVHPDLSSNPVEKVKRTKQFQDLSADWESFQKSEHFDKLSTALSTHVEKAAPQTAKKTWSWAKKHLRPRKLKYHAMTNKALHGTAIGAAGGGALGALGGAIPEPDRKAGESRKKNALKGALHMGVAGGLLGHGYGRLQHEMHRTTRFQGGLDARRNAKEQAYRSADKARREAERVARNKARSEANAAEHKRNFDAWMKGGMKGTPPRPKIEFGEMPEINVDVGDIMGRVNRSMRSDEAKAGVRKFFGGKGKPKTSSAYFTRPLVGGFFAELVEIEG